MEFKLIQVPNFSLTHYSPVLMFSVLIFGVDFFKPNFPKTVRKNLAYCKLSKIFTHFKKTESLVDDGQRVF